MVESSPRVHDLDSNVQCKVYITLFDSPGKLYSHIAPCRPILVLGHHHPRKTFRHLEIYPSKATQMRIPGLRNLPNGVHLRLCRVMQNNERQEPAHGGCRRVLRGKFKAYPSKPEYRCHRLREHYCKVPTSSALMSSDVQIGSTAFRTSSSVPLFGGFDN